MFKLLSDTFIINEVIDSISYEALLENEITINDNLPDIEKIISTEGKVKTNGVYVTDDKVTINGDLIYNIIYRSNSEEIAVCSMLGKIPFAEEIHVPGATDDMAAKVIAYIDYIDSEQLTERTFLIKAVVILDTEVINKHSVNYISSLESDGSLQAKTKNISYTDVVTQASEEININDAIEVNKGSDEVDSILKADSDIYVTNVDVMNDRMLVEGICKVGFLYTENNNLGTTGYVSEEFPFTHYIEVKNSSEDMLRDIKVSLNDLKYNLSENLDNEKKVIEFNANFNVDLSLFDTILKNIITDGYSTESEISIESSKLNLSSIKDIKDITVKYENNFDVVSGTIKDIYTIDISPKISEKRINDDKYIIDGFLDMNLLYLNGDVNKIDRAYQSMPFTTIVDVNDNYVNYDLISDVSINKCGAYRKSNNTAVINCDIKVNLKFKDNEELTVINNINEISRLDYNKMPSLIFRVVQNGETVWDIAKNYNISINYLRELNDISAESELVPGSKLIIARRV